MLQMSARVRAVYGALPVHLITQVTFNHGVCIALIICSIPFNDRMFLNIFKCMQQMNVSVDWDVADVVVEATNCPAIVGFQI